jgi:hypothetical protein
MRPTLGPRDTGEESAVRCVLCWVCAPTRIGIRVGRRPGRWGSGGEEFVDVGRCISSVRLRRS